MTFYEKVDLVCSNCGLVFLKAEPLYKSYYWTFPGLNDWVLTLEHDNKIRICSSLYIFNDTILTSVARYYSIDEIPKAVKELKNQYDKLLIKAKQNRINRIEEDIKKDFE